MSDILVPIIGLIVAVAFLAGISALVLAAYRYTQPLPKLQDVSVYSVIVNGFDALEFRFGNGQQFLMPVEAVLECIGVNPDQLVQRTDAVSNSNMGFVDFSDDATDKR